jgi:hypothetical protein
MISEAILWIREAILWISDVSHGDTILQKNKTSPAPPAYGNELVMRYLNGQS